MRTHFLRCSRKAMRQLKPALSPVHDHPDIEKFQRLPLPLDVVGRERSDDRFSRLWDSDDRILTAQFVFDLLPDAAEAFFYRRAFRLDLLDLGVKKFAGSGGRVSRLV